MDYPDPQNWIRRHTTNRQIFWQHLNHNVWMKVVKTGDHYNEEHEQFYRWDAKVTVGGTNLTVGESEHFLCEEHGDQKARELALAWAEDWMKNEFENWVETELDEEYRNAA